MLTRAARDRERRLARVAAAEGGGNGGGAEGGGGGDAEGERKEVKELVFDGE